MTHIQESVRLRGRTDIAFKGKRARRWTSEELDSVAILRNNDLQAILEWETCGASSRSDKRLLMTLTNRSLARLRDSITRYLERIEEDKER